MTVLSALLLLFQAASLEELASAVKSRPNDFNARFLYGAALSQSGNGDDALRQWRAAIALRPDHPKLLQIMAVEYSKGGYYGEAARAAERALTLVPAPDANLFLIAVKAQQDAGDHAKALLTAERMIRAFPESARAQFEYGYELHRNGRPAEALPYLKRAMSSPDAHEEPFYFHAELLMQERQYEPALATLRRAIALRRDYIPAWVLLARALIGLEKLDEARDELERAIAINPKHPQPHLLLSQVLFRQGDEAGAAEQKALSLRLRREDPGALESRPSRPFPVP